MRLQTIIRRVTTGVAPGPMGGARGLARVWVVPLAAVVLAVVVAAPAYAAAGDLDPAFGTGGLVVTDFGSNADSARDVALQSDGKIVVVGVVCVTACKSEVARYNPGGTLDPSFGSGGLTHFGSPGCQGSGVAIQTDGKILAADVCGNLVRLNSDGTPDPTFHFAGSQVSQTGQIALQSDGKIVEAGMPGPVFPGPFALERFNPDGSVDTSFGTDGVAMADFGVSPQQPFDLAIGPRGGIAEVGVACVSSCEAPDEEDGFALARFTSEGALVQSFGTGGKVVTGFGPGRAFAFGVGFGPHRRITAAGYAVDPANARLNDFALARYRSDGTLDPRFGGTGTVLTSFGPHHSAFGYALAVQPDGRVIVAGLDAATTGRVGGRFALARYLEDGSLDLAFGANGRVRTSFGGASTYSNASAVALQSDGKLVVAGGTAPSRFGPEDAALARYLT